MCFLDFACLKKGVAILRFWTFSPISLFRCLSLPRCSSKIHFMLGHTLCYSIVLYLRVHIISICGPNFRESLPNLPLAGDSNEKNYKIIYFLLLFNLWATQWSLCIFYKELKCPHLKAALTSSHYQFPGPVNIRDVLALFIFWRENRYLSI